MSHYPDKGENYIESKSVVQHIWGRGIAYFSVPITKNSRIRLDTPEGSNVVLKSLRISNENSLNLIDYGYDGPNVHIEPSGAVYYTYISGIHRYELRQLPRIWAENDKKNAAENAVLVEAVCDHDNKVFSFDTNRVDKSKGNYCLISITYDGLDQGGLYENNDEEVDAIVIFLNSYGEFIEEKCRYFLSLKKGTHKYLIRCSTDYYWYLNQINSFRIVTDGTIYNVSASILEGD